MGWLFLFAVIGTAFVDIKAQIDSLRKRRKLNLFRYGAAGNSLFLAYFLICGFLALLLSTVAVEHVPDVLAWPGSPLMLKSFYLGFAVSTNGAFLSRLLKVNAGRMDDMRTADGVDLSVTDLAKRELGYFHDQLGQKF